MELKDRIKALRTKKELTHTQLASAFSKTEAAVRAWEVGRTKPDADTLIKLADFFDCTTDYLLGISEYKNMEEKLSDTKKERTVSLYIEHLPFAERKELLDIFQAFANGYKEIDNDNLKIAFLDCFNEISGHIAETCENTFRFPEVDSETCDMLMIYILKSARDSTEALNDLYKKFDEYIESVFVKQETKRTRQKSEK